jgi:hypothetical protein
MLDGFCPAHEESRARNLPLPVRQGFGRFGLDGFLDAVRIMSNTLPDDDDAKKQGSSSIRTPVNFAASTKAVRIHGSLKVKVPGPALGATEASACCCTASAVKAILNRRRTVQS